MEKEKEILKLAFLKACEYIRENPPGSISTTIPFESQIALLAGGSKEDPKGLRYATYFLKEAEKDWKNKQKNESI